MEPKHLKIRCDLYPSDDWDIRMMETIKGLGDYIRFNNKNELERAIKELGSENLFGAWDIEIKLTIAKDRLCK